MTLISYELRRIIGRKGSFFGVMGVSIAIAALIVAVVPKGDQDADIWVNTIGIPLVFGGSVVGALEGSYDLAQGTMRYLVLTGVQRWKLVAIRVPALLIALVLIALPAMAIGTIVLARDGETAHEILRAMASGLTYGAIWSLVAMAIGTFLRSNGGGIAVAIVLFLLSNGITAFVATQISETLAKYLLPSVASVVALYGHADPNGDNGPVDLALPYGTALITLLLWLIAIVGFAIYRVERDEY